MSQHFLSLGFWLGSQVEHNTLACSILAKTECNYVQIPVLFPYSTKQEEKKIKKNQCIYPCDVYTSVCIETKKESKYSELASFDFLQRFSNDDRGDGSSII